MHKTKQKIAAPSERVLNRFMCTICYKDRVNKTVSLLILLDRKELAACYRQGQNFLEARSECR